MIRANHSSMDARDGAAFRRDWGGKPIERGMEQLDVYEREGEGQGSRGRPWLGLRFTCSGAYVRVFRSVDGSKYQARCPRCGKSVVFRVGEGGTSARFFEVDCAV